MPYSGERGFERATMREVAKAAGVAVGAAYYYFDSKDAIVLAFYEQAQAEIHSAAHDAMDRSKTLETRLRAVISQKFEYFRPNRKLLGALSAHANPEHPLSPLGTETAAIREQDIAMFERGSDRLSHQLSPQYLALSSAPALDRIRWVSFSSGSTTAFEGQERTALLYEKTLKMLLVTIRLAGFPLLRPLHKLAGELLQVIYGDE